MPAKDKLKDLKNKIVEENETKHGKEVRAKYGNEEVDKANKKLLAAKKRKLNKAKKLNDEIINNLKIAFQTKDPSSTLAQEVAELHKKWLMCYWDNYTEDAHAALAKMYVLDKRFKDFYDKEEKGLAEFLKNSILIYTKHN